MHESLLARQWYQTSENQVNNDLHPAKFYDYQWSVIIAMLGVFCIDTSTQSLFMQCINEFPKFIFLIQFIRKQIISILINLGADVTLLDFHSFTALHYACINNWGESIELLINHGADVNVMTTHCRSSLMVRTFINLFLSVLFYCILFYIPCYFCFISVHSILFYAMLFYFILFSWNCVLIFF